MFFFFDGSVKGLNEGSPVMLRGVKIGQVTNIKLLANPEAMDFYIGVYVEIDPENYTFMGQEKLSQILKKIRRGEFIKPLIEKGLRAQLQTQSFVTGQLMINVDFYPNEPARLLGIDKKYPGDPDNTGQYG